MYYTILTTKDIKRLFTKLKKKKNTGDGNIVKNTKKLAENLNNLLYV